MQIFERIIDYKSKGFFLEASPQEVKKALEIAKTLNVKLNDASLTHSSVPGGKWSMSKEDAKKFYEYCQTDKTVKLKVDEGVKRKIGVK